MFEARDKHTKYIPKKKQVFKMDQLICRAFTQHIIMGLKTQASYIQSLHTGYCVPPMHKAPKCSWVQIFWNFTFAPPQWCRNLTWYCFLNYSLFTAFSVCDNI